MLFYLGAHEPRWLQDSTVPLFVSMHRLERYRRTGDAFPKARCRWAMDSGSFTLLDRDGEPDDTDTFAGRVYRLIDDMGTPPDFVPGQDLMCEPWMVAKTRLRIRDHLELTVDNFCYLRQEFPHAPWIPVLQGWQLDDYLLCEQLYAAAGIDLAAERLVGLGSVCRRQKTGQIGAIVSVFHSRGYRLHGFGVKREGIRQYGHMLASADSMAWSAGARWDHIKLPGCTHQGYCNNCRRYALQWRAETVAAVEGPKQLGLDLWSVAA